MSERLSQLSESALKLRLKTGLRLQMGPFVASVHSELDELAETLKAYYPDYPLAPNDSWADTRVQVLHERRWRPCSPPEGKILLEDGTSFADFPLDSVLPYLEWGINWSIAMHAHQYFMLHAGVVERDAVAVVLPGVPGSGKSTLSTYLMHAGWRLLSDEFTLLCGPELRIQPFPRLIPLKNESIAVIRALIPNVKMGPSFKGTRKGTVAHVCPPDTQIHAMTEFALPRLVVFPTFKPGSELVLTPVAKAECFVEITKNSFNYSVLGQSSFEMAANLTDATEAYRLEYGDLREAESTIAELHRRAGLTGAATGGPIRR